MTRDAYHRELKSLEIEFLEMGAMVAQAVNDSVEALKVRDLETARKIIKNDLRINQKRADLEEKCLLLIAKQQPMAGDLRRIAAILFIITDLERIGDHAEGIAKITVMLGDKSLVKPLIDIPRMAEKGLSMLERSLIAFTHRDAEAARVICNDDDEVDALHDQIYRDLLLLMIDNPQTIEGCTYLTWVTHNLERIADRVTNIAERIVFMVTGKREEINVSKY